MRKTLIIAGIILAALSMQAQNWYQIGLRVSTQIPLVREYSDVDYLSTLRTPHVGVYFRAGKYVYGEVGIGYQYFRSRFDVTLSDGTEFSDMIQTHYLVLPFKAVGEVPITKKIAFLPYVGVLYQPLLKVSENVLGYDKTNIENQWALLTAGFDFRLGFITLGVDYRYSFQNYFTNKEGRKPQYIGISLGVIF
jgi:hypothetical protein